MRRRFYFIIFNIALIMMVFTFALGTPNPSNKLTGFLDITGNAVKVQQRDGCVKNIFSDATIMNIINDKVDYSRYYNLVVVKDLGEYYLLYYHNGDVFDSDGNVYFFEKNDLVCYDLNKLPRYIDIE